MNINWNWIIDHGLKWVFAAGLSTVSIYAMLADISGREAFIVLQRIGYIFYFVVMMLLGSKIWDSFGSPSQSKKERPDPANYEEDDKKQNRTLKG